MASELARAIEAILMVSDSPVEPSFLAELLEVPPGQVEELCTQLEAQYRDDDRGFMLVRVAGGFRYQSHPDLAPYLERYALEGQNVRLSAPAMETLAIVAYKQPVSRAQIAAIRGVNADGVLRTLAQRGYVAEVGRDPGPGQAVLYGTTPLFLERLGLDGLQDLPPLADFVPGPEIMEVLEHGLLAERRESAAADAAAGSGTAPGARPAASGAGEDGGGEDGGGGEVTVDLRGIGDTAPVDVGGTGGAPPVDPGETGGAAQAELPGARGSGAFPGGQGTAPTDTGG